MTLTELLVTLTVLGVMAAVAVPSFNEAVLGNKLASISNAFVGSAQLARSEAIKRNAAVKMCRSATGTSCAADGGWQQGWIVFVDGDGDDTLDAGETRIHYQQQLPGGFTFTGNQYNVLFQPSGLSSTTASLKVCRAQPEPGSQERIVALSATGRVGVTTTKTGSCS